MRIKRFKGLKDLGYSYFYIFPLLTYVTYYEEDLTTVKEKGIYFGWFNLIFYVALNEVKHENV